MTLVDGSLKRPCSTSYSR